VEDSNIALCRIHINNTQCVVCRRNPQNTKPTDYNSWLEPTIDQRTTLKALNWCLSYYKLKGG
jgi:hypothetical protein